MVKETRQMGDCVSVRLARHHHSFHLLAEALPSSSSATEEETLDNLQSRCLRETNSPCLCCSFGRVVVVADAVSVQTKPGQRSR